MSDPASAIPTRRPGARAHIIHAYFLREVLSPSLLALAVYTFLLLMNEFFLIAEYAHRYAVPLQSTAKLFVLQLPHVIVLTLPMSLLVGILVATARLAADSELIALSAAGISISTLLRPVLKLALLFTLLTGWLAFDLMPHANAAITTTLFDILQQHVLRNVRPGEFNARLLPGFTFYVREVVREPDGDRWHGVMLQPSGRGARATEVFFAREAWPTVDRVNGAVVVSLSGVTVQTAMPTSTGYDVRSFDQLARSIPSPSIQSREGDRTSRSVRVATLGELYARLAGEGAKSEYMARLFRVEIYKRFAIPAACLVFAFLGLGLGASARRSGRSFAFVVSLIVFITYQQLFFNGERLAVAGLLPPWLAMWAGNILFGVVGVLVFLQRSTEGGWILGLRAGFPFRLPVLPGRAWMAKAGEWWARRERLPRLGRAAGGGGWPSLIDRYVLGRFLVVLLFVVASALAIYVSVTLSQLLEDISKNNIPWSTIVALYLAWTPEILTYVLPVSVLVSTIVAFSLLTRTNEVTAMLVNGISRYRVVAPVVIFGLVVTVVALPLHATWLPRSNERYDALYAIVANKAARPNINTVGWARDATGDRFYHFDSYDPSKGVFSRLSYFELDWDSFAPNRHVYAPRAVWDGGALKLDAGAERTFASGVQVSYRSFPGMTLPFPESRRDFGREWRNPKHMTFAELSDYVVYRRAHGLPVRELEVELQSKRAFPFVSLVMMLLGLPFAFAIGKRGSLYGVGIAIVLAALFWCSLVVSAYLGKLGVLPPALAAWSPNLVFAFQGIAGFLSLRT
jgi:LPS export ABC transporter permease LptG/LPS export ABC transporter permease LptF